MPTIVNKYGIIHTVPDSLIDLVQSMGGRLATPEEVAGYAGGAPLVDVTPPEPERDDLTLISGVGEKTEEALNEFGIISYTGLITADPVEVAQAVGGKSITTIRRWQNDAHELSIAQREAEAHG